ncbi:amidohydrolase [Algoriphagus namhaensis]
MNMEEDELIKFRKYLHANPELSTQEYRTRDYLYEALDQLAHDGLISVGQTGLICVFTGKKPGKRLLFRTDIDALPIEEINDFDHKSKVPGVSHKCGHDGHATIMYGFARYLDNHRPEFGEVALLFQPAEETGQGAEMVMKDPSFTYEADLVFALHNLPGFEKHQIICKPGSFTSAVKSVIFKLRGKTAHAAEPENGQNPGLAVAQIIQLADQLSTKDPEDKNFQLATLIHIDLGEKAYGVSAGEAEIHFTLRAYCNEAMEQLDTRLLSTVNQIAKAHQLGLEYEYLEVFHATQNDSQAYEMIKKAADNEGFEFFDLNLPFRFGEDFGLFTDRFSGAMFGLGAGENTPALHNPDYDFPDELLNSGIRMYQAILALAQKN